MYSTDSLFVVTWVVVPMTTVRLWAFGWLAYPTYLSSRPAFSPSRCFLLHTDHTSLLHHVLIGQGLVR